MYTKAKEINIRDEKLSQWQGCVLLYRNDEEAL